MGASPQQTHVKALDGTVQPIQPATVPGAYENGVALPSRPKITPPDSSGDSIPPPGATLTGKQEHCRAPLVSTVADERLSREKI